MTHSNQGVLNRTNRSTQSLYTKAYMIFGRIPGWIPIVPNHNPNGHDLEENEGFDDASDEEWEEGASR
jgi:hypothetical protein